ncbi:MAG: hypothetical protein ABJ325_24505, partial [Nitratireductor sp.]
MSSAAAVNMCPMNRGAHHLPVARAAGRLFCAAAFSAALFLSASLFSSLLFSSPANAGNILLAEASGQQPMRIWSPEILGGADRELYRDIIAATERGHFKTAGKLEAKLKDKRLMGHVLYIKYMGPHYTTRYSELKAWLAEYNDHPGAADIYKLA